MRWITGRRLALSYRISWTDAERIVREESRRAAARGRRVVVFSLIQLAGLLWILAGAHWLWPGLRGWTLVCTEFAGLLLMTPALVLPRLLARDAILARAAQIAQNS